MADADPLSHDLDNPRLQAYAWLKAWFLARYEDPVENCPYESAEGGFQFLWGGPYDAEEELISSWAGIFTEEMLAAVAAQLLEEYDVVDWSGVPHG